MRGASRVSDKKSAWSLCIHVRMSLPNDFSASGGANSIEKLELFVGVWSWPDISLGRTSRQNQRSSGYSSRDA